ncbi:PHD finger protein 12 [Parelaphostrongylus tenuis]|uniref:PHD finger protein 12 n=1 Tax=Parelaphostrongylus tenuis TaxID=148309 RepID=A0AAD5RCL0_PARTN|nr:PHD finger protein 12 [Parelaphostrongylus tenuis]
MCPNHLEPYVDSKLLTSISVTERRRLWANYARQVVNETAIRRDFIKKIIKDRPEYKHYIRKIMPFSKRSGKSIDELCDELSSKCSRRLNLDSSSNGRTEQTQLSQRLRSSSSSGNQRKWSHDKIYSVTLPAYNIHNGKNEYRYVHVDFALDDDNSSLDCRSYSTLEDVCHRPIQIAANSRASSVSEIAETSFISTLKKGSTNHDKHVPEQDFSLVPAIPEQKHSLIVSQCNGSVLRALLDSAESMAPSVEPITMTKPFILRRTRRSKKFLIKSTS